MFRAEVEKIVRLQVVKYGGRLISARRWSLGQEGANSETDLKWVGFVF